MNFTIADIEDQSRTILLDTNETEYRYTPREIFIAIRDGMKLLRGIRPDSRYVKGELTDTMLKNGSTSVDFIIPADASGYAAFRGYTVYLEDRWEEALVYYVVYRMYLKDDADTVNGQAAQNYYAMFERSAQS